MAAFYENDLWGKCSGSHRENDKPEETRTCLNCLYEPEWTEFKHGVCGWPIDEKLPHGMVWTKRVVILKRDPHKNCPAWRPK